MTRTRQTPAERLAATDRDQLLADITARSDWDQHLVEQAVLIYGLDHAEWSCNGLRDLLPPLAAGYLGSAINSLRTAGIIEHTGRMVPSTNPTTHGHRIAIWRLSLKGHVIAAARPNGNAGEVAA
ncbi:hypothetical protein ACWGNE_02180 [Streptomyces xiamenensis]